MSRTCPAKLARPDRWRIARAIKNAAKRKPGGIFMLAPKKAPIGNQP
jgi:hypothetical protein